MSNFHLVFPGIRQLYQQMFHLLGVLNLMNYSLSLILQDDDLTSRWQQAVLQLDDWFQWVCLMASSLTSVQKIRFSSNRKSTAAASSSSLTTMADSPCTPSASTNRTSRRLAKRSRGEPGKDAIIRSQRWVQQSAAAVALSDVPKAANGESGQ